MKHKKIISNTVNVKTVQCHDQISKYVAMAAGASKWAGIITIQRKYVIQHSFFHIRVHVCYILQCATS